MGIAKSLRRAAIGIALALVFMAPETTPQEPRKGPAAMEEGAAAPAGEWTTDGGCPARTSVSLAPPLRGPMEAAWTLEAGGEFEGDPLVSGGRVLLTVRVPAGTAELVLVRLEDGLVLARRAVSATAPLLPSFGGGVVAFRAAPDRIELWRPGATDLVPCMALTRSGGIDSLLLSGEDLYLCSGQGVERLEVGALEPTWRSAGRFTAPVAFRGPLLYVMSSGARSSEVVFLDRKTGARRGSTTISQTVEGPQRLVVGDAFLFAYGWTSSTVLRREQAGEEAPRLKNLGEHLLSGEATEWGGEWFGRISYPDEGPSLVHTGDDEGYCPMTDRDRHGGLLKSAGRPSRTREVAWFGPHAVDLATSRILWSAPIPGAFRAIPTGDLLLVVSGGGRLTALARKGRAAPAPWISGPAAGPPAESEGRLVTCDGEVLRGRFTLDPGSGTVTAQPGSKRIVPAKDVLLFLDSAGRPLAARGVAGIRDALRCLADAERAAFLAGLANAAVESRDPALIDRLIGRARLFGAGDENLGPALRELKRIAKLPRPPKLVEKRAEAIRAKEKAAPVPVMPSLEALLKALPSDAPPALRLGLLRAVLDSAPDSGLARGMLRSLLPPELALKADTPPDEMFALLDAVSHCPVRILEPPAPGAVDIPPGQRMLGSLRTTWREDLVGVESGHLLVISSLEEPASLAHCLSLGELVCDTLEGFFAKGKRNRTSRWPLTLILFRNREEYQEQTRRMDASPEGEDTAEFTAGHYAPDEELSRLFLPAEEDGFRQVMGVFAHELTHQWIAERCPLFGSTDRSRAKDTPGFWIVEGFATLVEEFSFDLETRTFGLSRYGGSLCHLAAMVEKDLVPWPEFFAMNQGDFSRLSVEARWKLPAADLLGYTESLGPAHLFYVQAGAATLFLFAAEDGRYRERLMEFTGAYYRGENPSVEQTFGISAAELGAKTLAFSREFVGGAR